jgi:hypothetical protein
MAARSQVCRDWWLDRASGRVREPARRAKGVPVSSRLRWLPTAWALLLAGLMLGPALGSGYVLTYDMVWVPDLALRNDLLGLGSALPRAVPSDALVAVLDEVVPGMLLQKLVLVGSFVAAGAGGAALVADLSVPVRCLAASLFVWNPFVVERLVLGHWPVLLGYAALPWLVLAAQRYRRAGRLPVARWWLLPLGSLSASAGLASAVVVLAFGLARDLRANAALVALVAAANVPWVTAGLLHAGEALTNRVGAEVFALRGEGFLAAPLTALGLGGVWNSEVVPATREGVLAVVALGVIAALAGLGARGWLRCVGSRDAAAFAVCCALGWGVAVFSWAAPDAMAWLAAEVPGAGLLRDGSRLLGLCALATFTLCAHGAERLGGLIHGHGERLVVTGLLALVPVSLMPDAAWGSSGALSAVDYPASYASAREAIGDADGADVLVLPFSSYRAPAWNDGHKVLDPLGRYLEPDYVASDELTVAGKTIVGEDPRGDAVRRALAAARDARGAALARLGIGTVVIDKTAPGTSPDVPGRVISDTPELTVLALGNPAPQGPPRSWLVAMLLAWLVWVAMGTVGVVRACRERSSRNPSVP